MFLLITRIMSVLHLALFFCGFSAISAQSEVLPYRSSILLGRGYNLNNHRVGVDLFSMDEINKAQSVSNTATSSTYRLIRNDADCKKLLGVSSEFSLRVKAGIINVLGVGSYIKNVPNREKVVEVLVVQNIKTVKKTLNASAKPMDGCQKLPEAERGTHYIRSLQYGGKMVASWRIMVASSKEKQDIEAAIIASVGVEGRYGQEDVKAKLKKLQQSTGKYRQEYSIYVTILLDKSPGTVDEFLQVLDEFPQKVLQNGEGVPTEAEVYPIDLLGGCKPTPPINWRRNLLLEADIADFEEKFSDLKLARQSLDLWSSGIDLNKIKEQELKKMGDFKKKLRDVDRVLRRTITNLDLTAGSEQFKNAKNAYASDGNDFNNRKYREAFLKLKNEIELN